MEMNKKRWFTAALVTLLTGCSICAAAAAPGNGNANSKSGTSENTSASVTPARIPLSDLPPLPWRDASLETVLQDNQKALADPAWGAQQEKEIEDTEKAAAMIYYPATAAPPAGAQAKTAQNAKTGTASQEDSSAEAANQMTSGPEAPEAYDKTKDTRTVEEKTADWHKAISSGDPAQPEANPMGTVRGTKLGLMQGTRKGIVQCFMNIPYAEAPAGDRRFAPPVPVKPWRGTLDATIASSVAPQEDSDYSNEDCLKLNIWTAATDKQNNLPVYVWFHGGSFRSGSASQPLYDGTELAKAGIVVVSVDYRLGTLGFFASQTTEDLYGTTGNWGILDMIEALKWVQQNIEAFGGNPKQVTIGGSSAGSMAVSALITSPLAKGLFSQAVMGSGSMADARFIAPLSSTNLAMAVQTGAAAAKAAGFSDTPEGLKQMRELPVEDVMKIQPLNAPMGMGFWPVPDGKVIPAGLRGTLAKGNINKVNLFFGYDTNELNGWFTEPVPKAAYEGAVRLLFRQEGAGVLQRFPAGNNDSSADFQRLAELIGLRSGMYAYADSVVRAGGHAYAYRFDGRDPLLDGTGLGAPHGSELKYFFQNSNQELKAEPEQKALSRLMYVALTNFIKYGDPNGKKAKEIWTQYNPSHPEEFVFDTSPQMESVRDMDDITYLNQAALKTE